MLNIYTQNVINLFYIFAIATNIHYIYPNREKKDNSHYFDQTNKRNGTFLPSFLKILLLLFPLHELHTDIALVFFKTFGLSMAPSRPHPSNNEDFKFSLGQK